MIGVLRRAVARLEAHWLGDLIACACLFGTGWLALVIGYGAGLK